MKPTHSIPLSDQQLDPRELAGKSFVIVDTHELIVTLEGTEDVEEGDTINDLVGRVADDFPTSTWSHVDREFISRSG